MRFAGLHAVAGQPVSLDREPDQCLERRHRAPVLSTDPAAAFVVPTLADLNAAPADAAVNPNLYNPFLNALRISATQVENVSATATVYLDRDVIGFRVNMLVRQPARGIPAVPVVPFGILTDYAAGTEPALLGGSMSSGRFGSDNSPCRRPAAPAAGADGIPEITVTISRGRDRTTAK